ncbi:MAG: DUF4062 domain-containing protein, partial [Acidobacteria bacterium]|nr:DUF4062 domain-containing protein [Acidobacteriota bacterium]
MQWENVHIFISSTFNDMHAERDYLVKNVFPALSEWCEERKLRLIDIDLRWGVTAADSEAKNTVRACLRNIDECRPFFLCFLGQRRGWVPSSDDIGKDTYELFPNLLQKHYVGDTSVTELEILHALIDPLHNGILRNTKDDSRSGKAVEYAFFYLREQDYLKSIPHPDLRGVYTNEAERDQTTADKELACWREQEIPQTGRPVYSYIANWRKGENTPEIAMPLYVPTTAPKDSDVWKLAFDNWKKRWSETGIIVDDSGEITGGELKKAKNYNKDYTSGRLGDFFVKKQILNLLPLSVPCRAPKESDKWKNAFIRWKKHWFDVGVSVNEDGEITESELNKAKTYNESLIELSGKCQMKDRPLADVIIEQLKAAIAKRYPDHMTIYASTPLQ